MVSWLFEKQKKRSRDRFCFLCQHYFHYTSRSQKNCLFPQSCEITFVSPHITLLITIRGPPAIITETFLLLRNFPWFCLRNLEKCLEFSSNTQTREFPTCWIHPIFVITTPNRARSPLPFTLNFPRWIAAPCNLPQHSFRDCKSDSVGGSSQLTQGV